ncbi:phage holin family protein [Caldisericum sp. AR60]|uniref:phage holin family protein n=1 Tax=Caldisericum sp. AR60 TaxID=3397852 RepID=UPI0039FD1538
MKNKFLVSFIVNAVALYLVSLIIPGIWFDNTLSILTASLIFGIVNSIIRPFFMFLSLPLIFLTLGLFTFIINGLMLKIVSLIVPGFHVYSFWDAVFASLLLSVISVILKGVLFGKN